MASPSQPKSLIFDLEVAPGKADQPDRIFMVGALRPDTGEDLERKVDKDLPSVLDALDSLGQGAIFVLGHNVIDHDLPILKQQAPTLALHQLPVIDTLRLPIMADSLFIVTSTNWLYGMCVSMFGRHRRNFGQAAPVYCRRW